MKKLRTQRVLQEGFITFFEIIKAILMGIVEGITEWLPISSTGHMILVEQVVKFNASEEFMSMFRVSDPHLQILYHKAYELETICPTVLTEQAVFRALSK